MHLFSTHCVQLVYSGQGVGQRVKFCPLGRPEGNEASEVVRRTGTFKIEYDIFGFVWRKMKQDQEKKSEGMERRRLRICFIKGSRIRR